MCSHHMETWCEYDLLLCLNGLKVSQREFWFELDWVLLLLLKIHLIFINRMMWNSHFGLKQRKTSSRFTLKKRMCEVIIVDKLLELRYFMVILILFNSRKLKIYLRSCEFWRIFTIIITIITKFLPLICRRLNSRSRIDLKQLKIRLWVP